VIKSFKDKRTRLILEKEDSIKGMASEIQRKARIKLLIIDSASGIDDLLSPPGNRLEKLKGSRREQYSIRINNQWRICFRFEDGNFYDLEVVDYH